MISFSQPVLRLSSQIHEAVSLGGLIPLATPKKKQVFATSQDPLVLLSSCAGLAPGSFDFVFIDSPRATSRSSVNLWSQMKDQSIGVRSFAHGDPDYRFHLSANYLVSARFSRQCVAMGGVVAVTANMEMSMLVRGAFETVFGYDGFLGELVYQTRSGGGNDSKYMSVDHETLLIFSSSPSSTDRFMTQKSEKELKKYNETDEQGKYYWDTYIRKQARNYYPIICPDGSVMEKDEYENKISWLWSEKTFLEKKKEGGIKFGKIGGKWKIYYKDRLKDMKILRSVVLQKDSLTEIFEDYPDGSEGSELLTSQGTREVRGFSNKPDYLKSSKYYQFLFNVFAKDSSKVLVPFSEHFSAINGLRHSVSDARIFTSISNEYRLFFEERAESLLDQIFISDEEPKSPLSAVGELPEEKLLQYFESMISARYSVETGFYDYKFSDSLARYAVSGDSLIALSVSDSKDLATEFAQLVREILKKETFSTVRIFVQCDLDEHYTDLMELQCSVHKLPQEFVV